MPFSFVFSDLLAALLISINKSCRRSSALFLILTHLHIYVCIYKCAYSYKNWEKYFSSLLSKNRRKMLIYICAFVIFIIFCCLFHFAFILTLLTQFMFFDVCVFSLFSSLFSVYYHLFIIIIVIIFLTFIWPFSGEVGKW